MIKHYIKISYQVYNLETNELGCNRTWMNFQVIVESTIYVFIKYIYNFSHSQDIQYRDRGSDPSCCSLRMAAVLS